MKKNILYLSCAAILMTSCIKQIDKTYTGKTVVEIDAAPLNSNSVGVSFPIFTRVLPEARPISTSVDSTLRRFAKTVKVRLNLVGPQSGKDETVGYKIVSSPIASISFPATISGQTPSRAAGTLTVTDAVAGTHYTALTGKATIPANKSFGYIEIQVLDAGSAAGEGRYLGIRLDSTGSLLPSANYLQIGMVIDQR
ncbi:hypothetical protein HRG84_02065 [Flavisolibacter sp. BT320]|nr:hypothetical protein [Flavisolibacter longurius]